MKQNGFTLLELMVVVAIMAMATAGVSLAMRDNAQTALERDAQRLAVLFESARAQSRTSGVGVYWHTTAEGFRFEGLPPGALPERWLVSGVVASVRNGLEASNTVGAAAVQLGPEPMIGAQTVDLSSPPTSDGQAPRTLRIGTDGLRPFAVQAP
jgi:general secretion pathway protein H